MGRIIGLEVLKTKEVKQETASQAAPAVTAEAKRQSLRSLRAQNKNARRGKNGASIMGGI